MKNNYRDLAAVSRFNNSRNNKPNQIQNWHVTRPLWCKHRAQYLGIQSYVYRLILRLFWRKTWIGWLWVQDLLDRRPLWLQAMFPLYWDRISTVWEWNKCINNKESKNRSKHSNEWTKNTRRKLTRSIENLTSSRVKTLKKKSTIIMMK